MSPAWWYYEFSGLKICPNQPETDYGTVLANGSYQGYDDLLDSSASRQLMLSTLLRANRGEQSGLVKKVYQARPRYNTVQEGHIFCEIIFTFPLNIAEIRNVLIKIGLLS